MEIEEEGGVKRGMLLDGTGGRLDVLKTALSVFYSIRGEAADGVATAKYSFRFLRFFLLARLR